MVDAEYSRFLQTLITAGAPGDVCKIANLVRQHMDNNKTAYHSERLTDQKNSRIGPNELEYYWIQYTI